MLWRREIGSLTALEHSRDDWLLSVDSNNNPIITLPSPTLMGIPAGETGEQILLDDFFVRQALAAVIRNLFLGTEDFNWYRFADYNQASLNRLLVAMEIIAWPPAGIPHGDAGSPPVPWPDQAIALACLDETGQNAVLVRLQPEDGTWSNELTEKGLVGVQMWPGGRFLKSYFTGLELSWVIVEPDGTEFPVPPAGAPVDFMYRNGRYLVAPVPPPEKYTPYSHYYVLDWGQCLQGDCQWHDIPGYPIWSPDESQFLLQSWADDEWVSQILYGESLDGPFEFVAEGERPVWLDEGTISYRKMDSSGDFVATALVAGPIGGEPETLLTQADLEALLPLKTEDTSYWFYLADAVSDSFLIHVNQFQTYSTSSEPPPSQHYLLLIDGRSGEKTIVAEGEYLNGVFGGNASTESGRSTRRQTCTEHSRSSGRSLLITSFNSQNNVWSLDRYDLVPKQSETLVYYDVTAVSALPVSWTTGSSLDWSEDGQWLLIFRDGFLILLAPDYNYKQVIVPDTPGCFSAAWIKP